MCKAETYWISKEDSFSSRNVQRHRQPLCAHAISLGMVIYFQFPLHVAVASFLMVPVWATMGNLLRLVSIVFLLDWINIDLSQGLPHTILGLFTFAVSFTCDYCFICFFAELTRRKEKQRCETCNREALSMSNGVLPSLI